MSLKITFEVKTPEEAVTLLQKISGTVSTAVPSAPVENPAPAAPSSAPSPTPAVTTTPDEPGLLVSAPVRQYAAENNIDLESVTGTGKNGRITKADVTAAIKSTPPAPPSSEPDPFAASEPVAPPVVEDPFAITEAQPGEVFTKEDVRTALVTYQTKVQEKLLAAGKSEDEARVEAISTARGALSKSGGADNLSVLAEDKYGTVVTAVRQAIAAL